MVAKFFQLTCPLTTFILMCTSNLVHGLLDFVHSENVRESVK